MIKFTKLIIERLEKTLNFQKIEEKLNRGL